MTETLALFGRTIKPLGAQCARLLEWFNAGKVIDPMTAWRTLGIMRLSARTYDLRKAGYNVQKRTKTVSNRWGEKCHVAEYRLEAGSHER